MAERITPTRMNLIATKRRTAIAKKGHSILKKKREVLVLEFLKLLKNTGNDRDRMYDILQKAYQILGTGYAYAGSIELEEAADYVKEYGSIGISVKNIMGVRVPEIDKGESEVAVMLNMLSASVAVDDINESFTNALESIINVAQREQGLRRIVLEIEKTKRRVNAMDYIVIPRYNAQAKYISTRLEEMNRDTFSALKHVKKKLSKESR
jgi:V/A-type H+-transporting ATPase subunit D